MLKHASRSRHIDPDRPPAAAGGLRSQVPDLVHGPRELLDCRQLQQAGRRERTRFFDRRSRARASTWPFRFWSTNNGLLDTKFDTRGYF